MMQLNKQYMISIWWYAIVGLLFLLMPSWTSILLWIMFFLIVKDVSVYAIDLTWWIPIARMDLWTVNDLYTSKKLSTAYFLALINRIYLFPVILTIYLVYLLIQQTQLRDLHLSNRYLLTNEQVLLLLTILSGVFLVYQQEEDKKYEIKSISRTSKVLYYALSIVLWWLTLYIISSQVKDLGGIGKVISLISWVLVFLVGVLLMEEDEEGKEE